MLNFYRTHWYYLTLPVAMLVGVYLRWNTEQLSRLQILLGLNFMALLLHQFEEYVFPGGAPLFVNIGTFNE